MLVSVSLSKSGRLKRLPWLSFIKSGVKLGTLLKVMPNTGSFYLEWWTTGNFIHSDCTYCWPVGASSSPGQVWPLQHGRTIGKRQTVHLSQLQETIGQVSGNEADHGEASKRARMGEHERDHSILPHCYRFLNQNFLLFISYHILGFSPDLTILSNDDLCKCQDYLTHFESLLLLGVNFPGPTVYYWRN